MTAPRPSRFGPVVLCPVTTRPATAAGAERYPAGATGPFRPRRAPSRTAALTQQR
jgi:hypothetical protein